MGDKMKLMRELQQKHPKSYCPACNGPNKCAIEIGKSASTCWCMTVEQTGVLAEEYHSCLCHRCLATEIENNV